MTERIHDHEAEQTMAAIAAISIHGATLAASRLTALDFFDPRCWAVVDAGLHIDAQLGLEDRIAAAAKVANVWPTTLEEWVCAAPLQWDSTGTIAARVKAAADARRRAIELVDELRRLTGRRVFLSDDQDAVA